MTIKLGKILLISMLLAGILLCLAWTRNGCADAGPASATAIAQEGEATAADGEAEKYHTPLAGEPYQTVFLGRTVDIPARDRGQVSCLTLGGTYYTPKQGRH